jgi:carboxyl-terminal processing protease
MRLPLFPRLIAAVLSACLITACAAPIATAPTAAPTLAPSSTPFPPTATPLPPSATPLPPSPTAVPTVVPATATPSPSPLPLPATPTLVPLAAETRLTVFDETWALVRDRYVYRDFRGLDWDAVREELRPRAEAAASEPEFYAVMEELIERLGDEHSRFDTPQEVAEEAQRFSGTLVYAGIGALVRELPDGVLITRLAPGGPAEQAGVTVRDMIVAVNGVAISDAEHFGPAGPIGAVRGEPGTSVRLTLRAPDGAERDVEVVRRVIPGDAFPVVEARRLSNSDIGLLVLETFSAADLERLTRAALQEITASGPLDGLVVDVRGNGGGRIDLLLDVLGLFVDGGTIGASEGRNGGRELRVPAGTTMPQLNGVPVVVLTGEDTVSAAEMFAGGMQALGRAQVVGLPSAGNTENLLGHDLPDGSRLWLAELVFRLPDGTLIEGQGVQPDRRVDAEWYFFPPEHDPQVRAAIELLTGRGVSGESLALP